MMGHAQLIHGSSTLPEHWEQVDGSRIFAQSFPVSPQLYLSATQREVFERMAWENYLKAQAPRNVPLGMPLSQRHSFLADQSHLFQRTLPWSMQGPAEAPRYSQELRHNSESGDPYRSANQPHALHSQQFHWDQDLFRSGVRPLPDWRYKPALSSLARQPLLELGHMSPSSLALQVPAPSFSRSHSPAASCWRPLGPESAWERSPVDPQLDFVALEAAQQWQ